MDDNDYVPVMPPVMGRFHLPTILREAALVRSADDLEVRLESELSDTPLRQRFVAAYFSLKEAALSCSPDQASASKSHFICLNAVRRNLLAEELYRTVLYPKIDDLVEDQGDIPSFIEERVKIAELLMAPEKQGRFGADLWFGAGSVADANVGVRMSGAWVDYRTAVERIPTTIIGEELKRKIVSYAA
jgi:hypothetical protein